MDIADRDRVATGSPVKQILDGVAPEIAAGR